jgi:hypothetical protein
MYFPGLGCYYNNIKANFYSREFSFYIETISREVSASRAAIGVAYPTALWLTFPANTTKFERK